MHILTDEQKTILETIHLSENNIAIEATAGAAKSFILNEYGKKLEQTEKRYVVLTYSNNLAANMRESFNYGEVSTTHSYMNQIYRRYCDTRNIAMQVVKTDQGVKRSRIDTNLLLRTTYKYFPKGTEFKYIWHTMHYVDKVRINALQAATEGFVPSEYLPDVTAVLERLSHMAERRGVTDHNGLLYLLVTSESYRKFTERQAPVYGAIDECQDSTPLLRKAYQHIFKSAKKVILTGDTKQAIFGWAGSEHDSYQRLMKQFNTTNLVYTQSFRVPKKIAHYLNSSGIDDRITPFSDNCDGSIIDSSYDAMLATVTPGDLIMCRYNRSKKVEFPLEKIAFDLMNQGKKVKLLGSEHLDDIRFILDLVGDIEYQNLVQFSTNEIELLVGGIQSEKQVTNNYQINKVKRSLKHLLVYLEFYESKKLFNRTIADFREFCNNIYLNNSDDVITISSIHRQKGATWPKVYLCGVDEMVADIKNEEISVGERQETLHLLYVALTRTNNELVIVDGTLPKNIGIVG